MNEPQLLDTPFQYCWDIEVILDLPEGHTTLLRNISLRGNVSFTFEALPAGDVRLPLNWLLLMDEAGMGIFVLGCTPLRTQPLVPSAVTRATMSLLHILVMTIATIETLLMFLLILALTLESFLSILLTSFTIFADWPM